MNEFTSSILSGLTTALVWAVLLWLLNWCRNFRVERALRSSLCRIGTSYGDIGFGISLKNETHIPIIVRDATLLTKDSEQGIDLRYNQPTHDFLFIEKKNKKPMTFKTRTMGQNLQPETTAHGFVELPPYTGGIWKLDVEFFLNNPDLVPTSARATVEYKTFLGNPKLIIVRSNDQSAGLVRSDYGKFLKYIEEKQKVKQSSSDYRPPAAGSV